MKNPTVSIIIPVYNAEGTITRCLDSIIHQTYSSIEVIIIDDVAQTYQEAFVIIMQQI